MTGEPLRFSVQETLDRLTKSLETLEWALSGVPPQWLYRPLTGEWSVARNVAHLAVYEDFLAAPVLEDLAAGGDGTVVTVPPAPEWDASELALAEDRMEEALALLRTARQRQVEAARRFDDERFNEPLCPIWAQVPGDRHPAGWVATKTVQHTWEHGNAALQAALFAPR
jgi:hypothetical protein